MLQAMLDKKIPILQYAENKDKDFGSGYTIDSCAAVVLITRSSVLKLKKVVHLMLKGWVLIYHYL
ncbi:hypothetical protein [Guptibacillus sedimenti]|uniref:hypothetical protein n=1 Tax=Guptibacillus sedimenti TaxID=3025680 RepID=UPI00235F29FC|nr:hypothetical protein [Pseudalkalibacillus sedimenti]